MEDLEVKKKSYEKQKQRQIQQPTPQVNSTQTPTSTNPNPNPAPNPTPNPTPNLISKVTDLKTINMLFPEDGILETLVRRLEVIRAAVEIKQLQKI